MKKKHLLFRIGIDMVKDAVEISLGNEDKEIKVNIQIHYKFFGTLISFALIC